MSFDVATAHDSDGSCRYRQFGTFAPTTRTAAAHVSRPRELSPTLRRRRIQRRCPPAARGHPGEALAGVAHRHDASDRGSFDYVLGVGESEGLATGAGAGLDGAGQRNGLGVAGRVSCRRYVDAVTTPFRVDETNAQAWTVVSHTARVGHKALCLVGGPEPGSNFADVARLYPYEKVSDRVRAYLMAGVEHMLMWADLHAPLKFHE